MKKAITRFLFLGLSIISSIIVLNSCINNDDLSITEPNRYDFNDVKSYSDLFDVFWTTMDQRYNYFYEQKRKDGMNWSSIYREYSPKFKALKTFARATDDEKEIYEGYLKAKQYFEEIIDPIIDKHFFVDIYLEKNNKNAYEFARYRGGMLSEEVSKNNYPFASKYNYMKDRISPNSFISDDFALGGYLNSNSDIYYFTYSSFELTSKFQIQLRDKYFSPDNGGGLYLTAIKIDNSKELNSIKDLNTRKNVRDFTINVLNRWNEFLKSEEVETFNNEVKTFKSTEIVSDKFIDAGQKLLVKAAESRLEYSNESTYSSVLKPETQAYINWFMSEMNDHVMVGHALGLYMVEITTALSKAPFYKQFLNPLHKGEIKKLILDLRSNGGGAVVDARFFSDRFITKNEIFGYQRTKEGNGRFNYTPWVDVKTNPHQFSIPSTIPITILTDKNSSSMSEITTLMLKSQGSHVISIGDYSSGATAGLGGYDDFNGGTRDIVANRFNFYMPLMAFKDVRGEVIEGIGIKPDIYVTPPTDEELNEMQTNPTTFVDRVLNEAIKYLSSK